MLKDIPMDEIHFVASKASNAPVTTLKVATRTGSELAESILLALGLLARQPDYTDWVSLACADDVVDIMRPCINEVGPCVAALRCMYNCCFMNEMGQFSVLSTDIKEVIEEYRAAGIGRDPDIIMETRRLELALEPDGWRGHVERQMTREFKAEIAH
jgi:hypothetical protein